MLETILHWDYQLFFFINGYLSNDFLDAWMPLWRNKYFWGPLYLFITAFLFLNFKKQAWWVILFAVLTITIGDQVSSGFIKPYFDRVRPCNNPEIMEQVRLLLSCGGKSFVSSHATNHFAFAFYFITLFGRQVRGLSTYGFLWAASIALGQVYVGVHYPSDVICGAILGTIIGVMVGKMALRGMKKDGIWME